jgi:hypothetical protein
MSEGERHPFSREKRAPGLQRLKLPATCTVLQHRHATRHRTDRSPPFLSPDGCRCSCCLRLHLRCRRAVAMTPGGRRPHAQHAPAMTSHSVSGAFPRPAHTQPKASVPSPQGNVALAHTCSQTVREARLLILLDLFLGPQLKANANKQREASSRLSVALLHAT